MPPEQIHVFLEFEVLDSSGVVIATFRTKAPANFNAAATAYVKIYAAHEDGCKHRLANVSLPPYT